LAAGAVVADADSFSEVDAGTLLVTLRSISFSGVAVNQPSLMAKYANTTKGAAMSKALNGQRNLLQVLCVDVLI
jgi:S-adenosylmethionine hydrolase